MTNTSISAIALSWLVLAIGCWFGWQLLRQNGRILLRLDELEQRLEELEFGETAEAVANGEATGQVDDRPHPASLPQGEGEARTARFGNRSLRRSRIKRDGLKAGTPAPDFRLPRLDGGELSLAELRGQRMLLVFSDPECGPCNALTPQLEKFHREHAEISVVMISRGDPKENRAKVKEHGLTFPVVLQAHWEISRLYGMFATPVAYLIDGAGVIAHDVAVGVDPILNLMTKVHGQPNQKEVAVTSRRVQESSQES